MRRVVIDASALVEYLLRTDRARPISPVVEDREVDLHVPSLCDVEVASAFRWALRFGWMSEERAELALGAYLDLPLTRHGHTLLLGRALELRENFSTYDVVYIALAERLGATLLTGDGRLRRGARGIVRVEGVRP